MPVCWRTLGPHEAPAEWADLRDFVHWPVDRYNLDHRVIPPCWYLHAGTSTAPSSKDSPGCTVLGPMAFHPSNSAQGPSEFHSIFGSTRQRLTRMDPTRYRIGDHQEDPIEWPDDSQVWAAHLNMDRASRTSA